MEEVGKIRPLWVKKSGLGTERISFSTVSKMPNNRTPRINVTELKQDRMSFELSETDASMANTFFIKRFFFLSFFLSQLLPSNFALFDRPMH